MPSYRFILRRGNTAAVAADVPMAGELLLNTDNQTITVGNGAAAGGLPLSKASVGLGNVTNDAQLKASQLDDDGTMAANSATRVASQRAVRQYVASISGGGGGLSLKTGLRHWIVGRESDNAAVDLHGGATCTWVGTAATAAGLVGRALSFAGSSHVLLPADAARFDPLPGMTVAAWVRSTQAGTLSAVQYILGACKDYAANKRTFWIQLETARTISFKRSLDGTVTSASSNSVTGAPATAANAWALVVAVYSSQLGMHLYTLPASGGGNRNALASLAHHYNDDSRLAIGAFSETYTGERFVGLIDSVGVWGRALAPQEIAALWNGGAGLAYSAL